MYKSILSVYIFKNKYLKQRNFLLTKITCFVFEIFSSYFNFNEENFFFVFIKLFRFVVVLFRVFFIQLIQKNKIFIFFTFKVGVKNANEFESIVQIKKSNRLSC